MATAKKPRHKQIRPGRVRPAPWEQWDFEHEGNLHKAAAIQAVCDGRADGAQQQLAMKTIIEEICEYGGMSFSPDSERETVFAEGKRWIGAQVVLISRLMIGKLKGD